MESAIKLNINNKFQIPSPTIRANYPILNDSVGNILEKTFNVNNTSGHITLSKTIEYNEVSSYIERKVIDMNAQVQSEISKLVRLYRNVHIILFIISLVAIALSWLPFILPKDVSIVLKPLSVAFSLMIIFNYYLRRVK